MLAFLSLLTIALASPIQTVFSADPYQALSTDYRTQLREHVLSLPEVRLVELVDGTIVEITEGEKALLTFEGKHFVDVTNKDSTNFYFNQVQTPFPDVVAYSTKQLQPLFDHISIPKMREFLTKFSSFRTRYYRSQTGAESQQWLLSHLKKIAASNPNCDVKFTEFVHSWGQNSIIARFEAGGVNASDESTVIIGGHLDSTNLLPFLPAPGAGDDGSGSTTLVEAFSVLVNATYKPSSNPVEFHFYSGEEGGLLGSRAVAQDYAAKSKPVRSMLEMDMTSWVKKGTKPVFGVITDFVDPSLTEFIRKVITEYAEIGFVDTKCSYKCSDFSSWTDIGARSAFAIESEFKNSNPNIHSSSDRLDISPEFSFEHMAQFTRMAIGLVVELGGGDSVI